MSPAVVRKRPVREALAICTAAVECGAATRVVMQPMGRAGTEISVLRGLAHQLGVYLDTAMYRVATLWCCGRVWIDDASAIAAASDAGAGVELHDPMSIGLSLAEDVSVEFAATR